MTEKQFNRKIESVKEPLRRFLLGLCGGDSFTADDLAQDTLLKLLMSSATRRIGIRFKAWVFKTAFNVWLDNRYTRRCVSLDEMSYDVSDDGYAENCMVRNMDNYSELYLAIDGLNPKERSAVLLFYMEDKSLREVAAIMDVSVGTVKSLLSRGRENIQLFLENKKKLKK